MAVRPDWGLGEGRGRRERASARGWAALTGYSEEGGQRAVRAEPKIVGIQEEGGEERAGLLAKGWGAITHSPVTLSYKVSGGSYCITRFSRTHNKRDCKRLS